MYLAAFAIRPVQRFVREARKAQDLWSGSLLLSHLALNLVKSLRVTGAEVIYPFLPITFPQKPIPNPEQPCVTNSILARLDREDAPNLVRQAVADARGWIKGVADKTRTLLVNNDVFTADELRLWDEQIAAQFHIAWSLTTIGTDAPAVALERLQSLMGAAKQSRRIAPYLGDHRPKCTLSGDWERMGPISFNESPKDFMHQFNAFWRQTLGKRLQLLERRERKVGRALWARLERDGREQLCAVSLVKRLAPAFVLGAELGWELDDPDSPLRFPSTAAIAWVDQKERVARLANGDDEVLALLNEFHDAVAKYCNDSEEPRGRNQVPAYHDIVRGFAPTNRKKLHEFLQLDGTWLSVTEPDPERARRRKNIPVSLNPVLAARRNLIAGLRERNRDDIDLNRAPPLALLRADADGLGKKINAAVTEGGFDRAAQLSQLLAEKVMPRAVKKLESTYRGKVIFAGGDELLAMVPAIYTLDAMEAVSLAYEEEGKAGGFPDLTCSVGAVVIAYHQPLRLAIEKLNKLLKDAKAHKRPPPNDPTGEPIDRRALGLAILPGSGNIKRGVLGLTVARRDQQGNATEQIDRSIPYLLKPLAEMLTLPRAGGIQLSPKLFRGWLENLDPGPDQTHLPSEFRPDHPQGREPDEGIALAEFRRMAHRQLDVRRDYAACWTVRINPADPQSPTVQDWVRNFLGETLPEESSQDLKHRLVAELTARLRTLLFSGSSGKGGNHEKTLTWSHVVGLLLGVTTLGTREMG